MFASAIKRGLIRVDSTLTAEVKTEGIGGSPIFVMKEVKLKGIEGNKLVCRAEGRMYHVTTNKVTHIEGMPLDRFKEAYKL